VWDFFIDSVFSRYNAKSSSGKAKIGREICPILAEIDDKIVQAHYAKVLAERLDVPLEAVTSQIEKTEEKVENKKDDEKVLPKVNKGRRQLLEENLLALSFQGDIEKLIELPENLFETPLLKRIYEEFIVYIQKVENFDPKEFEEELSQELREGFRELVLVDVKDVVDRPDDLKSEVSLIIKELGMLKMKTTLTEMASRMKVLEKDGNSESLKDIEESFSKLSHELSTLKTNK
jgi:DNA primase